MCGAGVVGGLLGSVHSQGMSVGGGSGMDGSSSATDRPTDR